jgi:hypothetical protein
MNETVRRRSMKAARLWWEAAGAISAPCSARSTALWYKVSTIRTPHKSNPWWLLMATSALSSLSQHLSTAGVHTKGILWKLSDPTRPQHPRPSSLSIRKTRSQKDLFRFGLDNYQRSRLLGLIGVLNKRNMRAYRRLANDLEAYLG